MLSLGDRKNFILLIGERREQTQERNCWGGSGESRRNASAGQGFRPEAMAISLNRAQGAQGAQEAGNTLWQAKQRQAAQWYALQFAAYVAKESSLISSLQKAFQNVLPNVTISASQLATIRGNVLASGFNAEQSNVLAQAGASSEDERILRLALGAQGTDENDVNLSSFLTSDIFQQAEAQELKALVNFGADRNGDGSVSCQDLALVRSAFGSRAGQSRFDLRADINLDGVVDVRDLSLIAQALPANSACK